MIREGVLAGRRWSTSGPGRTFSPGGATEPPPGGQVESDRTLRVGLCASCRHAREVPTPRAVYWLCGLSAHDARFAKYPRLPVLECEGYEPGRPETPLEQGEEAE